MRYDYRVPLALATLVVLAIAGCQNPGPDARSRAELDKTITAFYAAINTGETARGPASLPTTH